MSSLSTQRVLSVHHWTDDLFSFRTTRDSGLRFINGQFVMLGLEQEGRPLTRAYSIASANHEEQLEFYSIKVPGGRFTPHLQQIREGDPVLIEQGRHLVATFHPELTKDDRVHRMFVERL